MVEAVTEPVVEQDDAAPPGAPPELMPWPEIVVEPGDLTAPDVPEFARAGWGHRGYEPEQVDSFVADLVHRIDAGRDEVADLRRELDRLHRYIRKEWSSAARGQAGSTASATLAQAEEIAQERMADADRRLEEARTAARRTVAEAGTQASVVIAEAGDRATALVDEAEGRASQRLAAAESMAEQALARAWKEATHSRRRAEQAGREALAAIQGRYQEIVVRAYQRAEQAASNALHDLEHQVAAAEDPAEARAELQLRAAYLTTSAEVSRAAMRAALSFAEREFDRITADSKDTPTPPAGITVIELPD